MEPPKKNSKQSMSINFPHEIYAMALSSRNRRHLIAVGSFTRNSSNRVDIYRFDPDSLSLDYDFPCSINHTYPPTKLMFHPTYPDLLASSGDNLCICNTSNRNAYAPSFTLYNNSNISEYRAPLTSLDWNETEYDWICTSSMDGVCTVWDVYKSEVVTEIVPRDKEVVYDIAWGGEAHVLATASADGSVRMFDLRDKENSCGTIIYKSPNRNPLLWLAWNKHDSVYMATTMIDSNLVVILDKRYARMPVAELDGHKGSVNAIAWEPQSSRRICSGGDDAQVLMWELPKVTMPGMIYDGGIDPISKHGVPTEIHQLQWCAGLPDWMGVTFGNKMQLLKVRDAKLQDFVWDNTPEPWSSSSAGTPLPIHNQVPDPQQGHGPFDMFRSLVVKDLNHTLKVSLEDLYYGTIRKLSISRNIICTKCNGKGSKSGASMNCLGCKGSGMKVTLGPSMVQKKQHSCDVCKGTGETINVKDCCPQCKGDNVVKENKVFEVHVEKGMKNEQKITFPGEAHEAPDTITGDLVFILQQIEHPKFKRKGDDLIFEHTLSLMEALCGFQFTMTHLDGRKLVIKSGPGEVIKPDQYKAVIDEGMPMYRSFMKGKLYIHFTVEFPDSLKPIQCRILKDFLPQRTFVQHTDKKLDECKETTLHDTELDECSSLTRGQDFNLTVKVSLEDLYNGTVKKFSLPRNIICTVCDGKGSKPGASMNCPGCKGSGMKVTMGPSMVQQMQHACDVCKGTGETITVKDRCPQCKGDKVVKEERVLQVNVYKGMENEQKITLCGEDHEALDTSTGAIFIVLQQKEHPKFKRNGDDLIFEHTLSLMEALCGFEFTMTHLDGRSISIKSGPGEVVKPDQYKVVNDEGMPMYQMSFMKGKLYIRFNVQFPDSLEPVQCKILKDVMMKCFSK